MVTEQELPVVNERFFYLSVLIAGGIGFSVGKVLDNFEIFMRKKVDEALPIE